MFGAMKGAADGGLDIPHRYEINSSCLLYNKNSLCVFLLLFVHYVQHVMTSHVLRST